MSKNPWIDVSVPVHNSMHFWHGDPPPYVTMHAGTAKGDVCNVSVIYCSFHTGTHMDSPMHFLPGKKTMDDLPFDAVIGTCDGPPDGAANHDKYLYGDQPT